MIKTNILIGFLTGISANVAGVVLYILLFADTGLESTVKDALTFGYLSKIIALGAALNFLPFFVFLKKNLIYHARGVLLATVITAVAVAVLKII